MVEFALIAPVLITMLIGVVQVGTWVQAYNAVRNTVNDTTRFAMVEYQRGNKISDDAIENRAKEIARGDKYNLDADLVVPSVTPRTTQVSGVKQLHLVVQYQAPAFLPLASVTSPTITYGRDVYLYDKGAVAGT